MKLIHLEELKQMWDEDHDFKLVFVLGEWHWNAKHIPRSIRIDNMTMAKDILEKDEEIVLYCSSIYCPASPQAYYELVREGYTKVRRFAGGIAEWEEAGYPLEGEEVEEKNAGVKTRRAEKLPRTKDG